MRMVLDFLVYLKVVALFNIIVDQEDETSLTPVEIVFATYLTVRLRYIVHL